MSRSKGAEFWRLQIEAQRISGLSAAGYCRMHGLSGIEVRLTSGVVLDLAKHFDGASLRRAVEALR